MKQFWTLAAAGALAVSLLGITAPPANSGQAMMAGPTVNVVTAKTPPAKIKLAKKKTITTKAPNKSTQKYVLPVLSGSTAKNRKLFTQYATAAVKAELSTFHGNRKGNCLGTQRATLSIYPGQRAIYQGRYASVAFSINSYVCGATTMSTVRSFTLDLKTGKKVGIETFLAQNDLTTKVAIATNFGLAKNSCTWPLDPFISSKSIQGYIPKAIAWNVTSKGIRLHFSKYAIAAGYCGPPSVLLPWTEVTTAKKMKGTVKNRVYTNGIKWNTRNQFYEGGVLYVATQGRKLTMFTGPVGFGGGTCLYGIRVGKAATLSPGVANYDQPLVKARFSFLDTTSNPKLNTKAKSMGKGWKLASAKDLTTIKKAQGKISSARSFCRG